MKKIWALLLVFLFVFSACGTAENDTSSVNLSEVSENTAEESSQPEEDHINLIEADYKGEEFTVLTSGVNPTFHSEIVLIEDNQLHNDEELFPDRLQEAIRTRNNEVYEKIGVKIKEIYIEDSKRYNGIAITTIRNDAMNGEERYQAIAVCVYDCGVLAMEGLLYDFKNLENIDTNNPWWDQSVNEGITIENKLFFMMGDIGINHKGTTPAVFFNKTIFKRLNLEDPYQLVRDYKWTLDKVYQICKDSTFARDLNNDEIIDYRDEFCWGGQNGDITNIMYGSGIRILSTDSDGLPTLTFNNEKTVNVVNKIFDFMLDSSIYVRGDEYFNVTKWPMRLIKEAFVEGRAMFYSSGVSSAIDFGEMEDDFGILPVPLYDENQTEYYSQIGYWTANGYGIAINIDKEKAEFAAAVLDYMGYSSWAGKGAGYLATEYYEVVLKMQKLRSDEEALEILDKLFEARGCDLGAVYSIGGKSSVAIPTMLGLMMNRKEKGTFTSEYQKYENGFITDTQILIDSFKNQ